MGAARARPVTIPVVAAACGALTKCAIRRSISTTSRKSKSPRTCSISRHIVNQKDGRFEPDKFEDQYETALVDLINQKRAGKPITPKERPRGENVVDLMEALRRRGG